MSYRGFKRLLGETSLERKCRFLLGGGIFVLILVSFLLYWYQTEGLVWNQTELTCKLLVNPILLKAHWPSDKGGIAEPPLEFLGAFPSKAGIEDWLPEEYREYQSRFVRPDSTRPEDSPLSSWEREALGKLKEKKASELTDINRKERVFHYLGAIRLRTSCMACHPTVRDKELARREKKDDLKEGDLVAAVSLKLPLDQTEMALNVNRAILLSFAIGTAILAMIFAYVTVRYVIVKPVAHLKEVSEEIASGNLDIRASIQTGDEFQELSHAYNRMLRSLVSMQDELRRVNTDLDHKLDELAQANMALFEMNRLKSEFLATISHELRTPLNSILGFSDVLADANNLDAKQKRWIDNIQSSGKMLLTLINDILDLAKLEAGKMRVHVDEFSLRDLIEGQLQMQRPLADKKNIALDAHVDPVIPILKQDGKKLEQILSNLLSNAIKFTPEGGQITVTCKPDRAHIILSVTDNGVGIAPGDQKLIFEKFRQAESGLTRHHGGTGLGLSIVRELTKLLGGDEVQLESELGRGSSFTIRIPMHLDDQQQAELSLGDESLEFNKARQSEVRYFISKDRAVGADMG